MGLVWGATRSPKIKPAEKLFTPLPRLKKTLSRTLILPCCSLSGRKCPGRSEFCKLNKKESSSEHRGSMIIDVKAFWKVKGIIQRRRIIVISVFAKEMPEYFFSISGHDTPRACRVWVRIASETASQGQWSSAVPLTTNQQAPHLFGLEFPYP